MVNPCRKADEERTAGEPEFSPEALRRLIESCDEVIVKVLASHFRGTGGGSVARLDEEDLRATTRMRILERLQTRDAEPIADLQGYAARVAHVVWAEHCRARQPERTRFLDQVRYFLENDETPDGVRRWEEGGVAVCGFVDWRGKRAVVGPDLTGPAAAGVAEAVARRRARSAVRQLLVAIGAPVKVRDLNELLGRILDVVLEQERASSAPEPAAETPSLHGEIFHRENLRWLWAELGDLPRRQRVAFLLHAGVTKEFEYEGVASIREIAALLGLAPEDLAEWWFRIPLDDRTIAATLSATRQEVINLRKAARTALGRRLAIFLRDAGWNIDAERPST